MSDLRGESATQKVQFGTRGKIVAAAVVLLAICALAAYGYKTGQFRVAPKPVVTNSQLPTTPSH